MKVLLLISTFIYIGLADQAKFDAYVKYACPQWLIEVNKGLECCCYEAVGDSLTCAVAKTNFFANQVACKWDGQYSESLAAPTGVCSTDSNLYKQVYSNAIGCLKEAAEYAGGDASLMPSSTNDTDSLWILLGGFLVFFMQTGFASLEVGSCRSRGAQNILLKNMTDNCVGSLIWWAVGYAIAYGDDLFDAGILGGKDGTYFFGNKMDDIDNAYRDLFFQLAFATTSATIVSGGIAGRTNYWAYMFVSIIMTSIIYPVVVHWTWGAGWLADAGYYDFAGSGIVHMVGGTTAMIGALIAGPRLGRWDPKNAGKFNSHNVPLVVLGTLILWFGWFGFNAGSTLSMTGGNVSTAGLVSVNTMIAASSGGLVTFVILSDFKHGSTNYSVGAMCNGILAGLVGITAPCGNVNNGNAIVIGAIGGLFYVGASKGMKAMQIDDPLDAFAVHCGAGFWGVLSVGFFDKDNGLFYGAGGKQLWVQFYSGVCIFLWTAFWAGACFGGLKAANVLRISREEEEIGLDIVECGGNAYEIANLEKVSGKGTGEKKVQHHAKTKMVVQKVELEKQMVVET